MQNQPVENQAAEVRQGEALRGRHDGPVKLAEDAVVGDALKLLAEFKMRRHPCGGRERQARGHRDEPGTCAEKKMGWPVAEVMTREGLIATPPQHHHGPGRGGAAGPQDREASRGR
ncbi:MAG: hypothetical protein R2810_04220 [Flavobacteriales bacterium]